MMFCLRTAARPVASRAANVTLSRGLSTQTTEAVEKLRSVLETYRQNHYQQELPTRFKKDVTKAAVVHDNFVGPEGVQRVLVNIGAQERLSKNELIQIFSEVGQNGEMPATQFLKMI